MKITNLIVGVIVLLVMAMSAGWYLRGVYQGQSLAAQDLPADCSTINVESVKQRTKIIEDNKHTYTSTTRTIFGKSTEGGEQNNFLIGGQIVLKEQVLYGETGKSEASYYLRDGKVFYIKKKNFEYFTAIYDDSHPSGEVKNVATNEFYLNGNQQLCAWHLDGQLQAIDKDTIDQVSYLISGLLQSGKLKVRSIKERKTTASSTVTYGYDHAGQRVSYVAGGTTTHFPSRLYEVTGEGEGSARANPVSS